MAYTVRWVDLTLARDEHLDVWRRNLPLPVPARRRLEWLYRDNPAGPGRLALLETDASSLAIGSAGYGRRDLHTAGRILEGAVLADLAVDRAHRTGMPALMLVREVRSQAIERHQVVYGLPNAQAAPVLRKMGYRLLGEMRRYGLVLRHAHHIDRWVANTMDRSRARWVSWAAPLVGAGLDLARRAQIARRAAPAARAFRLDFFTEVDERFDRLWETARHDYPLVGVRDAAFVRWRFLDRPEGRLELAALLGKENGNLEGYSTIRREGRIVHLYDLFAPRNAVEPLLRLLCARFVAEGMQSISFRFLGAPWLVKCLAALGFRERADRRSVVFDTGSAWASLPAQLCDEASWYLTDADEDA